MLEELLHQLRSKVAQSPGLSEEAKSRLLQHVNEVQEHANSGESGRYGAQSRLARLSSTLEELEDAHPEITTLVGRIAVALGNMGI